MSASEIVPQVLRAKTAEELSKKIRLLQAASYAKLSIVTIIHAPGEKEPHICWYYPAHESGAGLF